MTAQTGRNSATPVNLAEAGPDPQQPNARRAAIASTVGAVLDWYDFFLYGTAAALVLGPLFFPGSDPLVGVLAAFATYAVGFLFRPLGGAIFGHFGDKLGRKNMLLITVGLMGLASGLVGMLPTYSSIGILAPVLLVLLRAVQGIAVGGEWGGAALMAVESAPKNRRNFLSSGVQAGSFIGLLLGTAAFYLMRQVTTSDQFMSWGWRIPFLISFAFAIIALVVRSKVPESPEFEKLKKDKERAAAPLSVAVRKSPLQILAVFGMRMLDQSTYYIAFTFALSYVNNYTDQDPNNLMVASMICMVLAMFTQPLWAKAADRWGIRWFYVAGPLCAAAAAVPFFASIVTGNIWLMLPCFFVLINLGHNLSAAVQQVWFSGMFPAEIRYSGAGFGYALAGIIGGIVPLVGTLLVNQSGGSWWPVAIMLVIMCLLALVTGAWSYKWTDEAQEKKESAHV